MAEAHRPTEPKGDAKFLWLAYCGLVLRDYNKEKDIPDPILKQVWRRGKRIAKEIKR